MSEHDIAGLLFTADMYGVQLDQLAARLGMTEPRARALAARWRQRGYADTARLGPGSPWVWLTRAGLAACGLPYRAAPPALSRLAHLRAVTAVRLALEGTPEYTAAAAHWRSERRLRARMGSRVPLREHLPDGEVLWPDSADLTSTGQLTQGQLTQGQLTPCRGRANAGPSRRSSPVRPCRGPRPS